MSHALETAPPPAGAINSVMRRLLASRAHRAVSGRLLLLQVRGRSSGRQYDIPVGYHLVAGTPYVLTHGRWRANLRGGAAIAVIYHGTRRPAHAVLLEDPGEVADLYAMIIARLGPDRAGRRLGLRLPRGQSPDRAELLRAAAGLGLAAVRLELQDAERGTHD